MVTDSEARKAFLLMPFDLSLGWLHELLVAAGADVGVVVERADDIFVAGVVIDQVKARIRDADAVIAVCTGRNANVFYEMGLAEDYHAPVMIAETEEDLPFDIQHFRAQLYGYAEPPRSLETLRARVGASLQETIAQRLPRGRRLSSPVAAQHPRLEARVFERSKNSHIFEVTNRGNIALSDVSWELPAEAVNWQIFTDSIPSYPVALLEPGDQTRTLVSITMGGPVAINVTLRATLPDGESYERICPVSIW